MRCTKRPTNRFVDPGLFRNLKIHPRSSRPIPAKEYAIDEVVFKYIAGPVWNHIVKPIWNYTGDKVSQSYSNRLYNNLTK